jgi:hypothetical protein
MPREALSRGALTCVAQAGRFSLAILLEQIRARNKTVRPAEV